MTDRSIRAAVVGGGITGLVAAYRLRTTLGPDAHITVVEASDRLGGALRTVDLAGGPVDVLKRAATSHNKMAKEMERLRQENTALQARLVAADEHARVVAAASRRRRRRRRG